MQLLQAVADNAARCRFSLPDTLTMPDGTFIPVYKCRHPELSPRGDRACRMIFVNMDTGRSFGCEAFSPADPPPPKKPGLIRRALLALREFA